MKLWNSGKDSSLFKYGESNNRKNFMLHAPGLFREATHSVISWIIPFILWQSKRSSLLRGNVNYVAKKFYRIDQRSGILPDLHDADSRLQSGIDAINLFTAVIYKSS